MKKLTLYLLLIATSAHAQTFNYGLKGCAMSGGGNATVPNTAQIQPPQAFVDNIASVLNDLGGNWTTKGFTYFDGTLVYNGSSFGCILGAQHEFGVPENVNLSGNALSVASINSVLADTVSYDSDRSPGSGILNLSGGTNAAPTGQGITDKNTLIANGWTVTTN